MQWQDWVFSVGGFVMLLSLIPTIRAQHKPALATSVMTTVLVAAFTVTMGSLGLWASTVANAAIAVAWGVLVYQKYWQMHGPIRTAVSDTPPIQNSREPQAEAEPIRP